MAKRKSITIGAVIGILIILALIVGGVILLFGAVSQSLIDDSPNLCSGQVLTIDPDINIQYSNNLNKDVILVRYSTLPSGECLNIRLSEEQIEEQIDGFDASGDVLMDIELVEQRKIFNIHQESQTFRDFDIHNVGYWTICADWLCEDFGYPNVFASLRPGWIMSDCYCISDNSKGTSGDFLLTEGIEWEVDFKLGSLPTVTLTHDHTSDTISSIAYAEWSGNLGTDVDFGGIVGQKDTYKPYSNNIWRMISQGTYGNLNQDYNYARDALINCENEGGTNCDDEITNAYGYNNEFAESTLDQTWSWAQSEPAVDEATIQSNQLIAILQSPIVYPTFILEIDAEEVGIFQTVGGDPDVTCPSDFDIDSGETVTKTLSVRNTGQHQGVYEYSISCNEGSQFLSPQPPQNIAGSQTLNIEGTFGFTVESGTETADCTFTAIEQISRAEDSCTFGYDSTYVGQCVEGTKTCEVGNTEVWTCLEDGSYDREECEFGCSSTGGAHCVAEGEDDDDDGNGVPPGITECSGCFTWLWGKISDKPENQCTDAVVWESDTWLGKLFGVKIKQDSWCPFFLIGLGSVILIVLVFLFILITIGIRVGKRPRQPAMRPMPQQRFK